MLEKLGVSSNNILPLPNVILEDPYLLLFNTAEAPGTPPQAAPDYVLNPLSIYRMARNKIPERHAPENAVSPAQPQDQMTPMAEKWPTAVLDHPSRTSVTSKTAGGMLPISDGNQDVLHEDIYSSMEGFGTNLDMFFAPDQNMDWLAADEAVTCTGMEGEGLLQWMETSQMREYQF